jgi:predicted Zn-dependent protease
MIPFRSPNLVLSALCLLALLVVGCGEMTPEPKVPGQPPAAVAEGTAPGQNADVSAQGLSVSDAPSSANGEAPSSGDRPHMNAQAAEIYERGLAAFGSGDLVAARTSFLQATQADARAYQAFYSLGVVQDRLHDASAASSYRQAYNLVPDYELAIVAEAMSLARRGNASEAERILTEKRGQFPKSAAITAALAEVKSQQKDSGSAQRLAQEALKINPDYRPAMVIIARDHYRNRRLDLALYALQAILDGFGEDNPPRDKNNAEAHLLRGLIWKEQGNRAGAMDEFRQASALRTDLVEAGVQYATYLLQSGGAEEALRLLETSKRFDAENIALRLNLGDAYRLLGQYDAAKQEFDWVTARDASLPQVHYDLGLLYLFAPAIPGMSAKDQLAEATKELKRFQDLRSKGEQDDSAELLERAKLKDGELNAAAAAAAQPATAPDASGGAQPSPPPDGAGAAPAPEPAPPVTPEPAPPP